MYSIIVKENIVMIDNESVSIDCSSLKNKFVFCQINEDERWIEKEPFTGKITTANWTEILLFIEAAKVRLNTVEEIDNSIVVPTSISMRKARLYLYKVNLLDGVEEVLSSNEEWKIQWDYSASVDRKNELVLLVQERFKLTDTEVDSIFIEANKL